MFYSTVGAVLISFRVKATEESTFSQEILKRKRNGFGIYWLAATLGSKGASFRKFSRKEVLACDVAKAWYVHFLKNVHRLPRFPPIPIDRVSQELRRVSRHSPKSDRWRERKLSSRN